MQRLALAFGAACALVQAQPDLEDASQLFQNSAVVREAKPRSEFMKVWKESLEKWKHHKEDQMKELEPWKFKELQKKKVKARHEHAEQKPTPAPKRTRPLTDLERKEMEHEARLQAMGAAMTFIVREPSGREFIAKFHNQAKMQILLHSMCTKLGLKVDGSAGFTKQGQAIDLKKSPLELGLNDQDVLEIDTDELRAIKAKQEREAARASEAAALQEKHAAEDQKAMTRRMAAKLANAKRSAKEQAEQKMKHDLKKADMTTLRFQLAHGDGSEIHINVKKNNWLQGTMELVCKRMELNCVKSRFYASSRGQRAVVSPHDTARSLRLGDDELIMVRGFK